VAGAAEHGVGAGTAVDEVGAAVADDAVVQLVAGAGDVGAAGELQFLDIGRECVADAGLDCVVAGVGVFGHGVAGVVDDVGVVARTAGHRVGARLAVDEVGAGVAGDDVVGCVAGGVDVAGTQQRQVLEVVAQRPGDGRADRVRALAGVLGVLGDGGG